MTTLYERGRAFAAAYWARHPFERTRQVVRQLREAGEPDEYVAGAADVLLDIAQTPVLQ